jgi:hypothetical protein
MGKLRRELKQAHRNEFATLSAKFHQASDEELESLLVAEKLS